MLTTGAAEALPAARFGNTMQSTSNSVCDHARNTERKAREHVTPLHAQQSRARPVRELKLRSRRGGYIERLRCDAG